MPLANLMKRQKRPTSMYYLSQGKTVNPLSLIFLKKFKISGFIITAIAFG
jgi:hypothetical protein